MDVAPSTKSVDDIYYEVAKPGSLSERVMIFARDAIYQTFMCRHPLKPADSIVDVGVSDVIANGDNMIERKYPYPSAITAAGLGDGHEFRRAFPDIKYVQVEPGAPLPFADRQFRIAVSNAVLEHVGSLDAQQAFTEELLRVADEVFLTVPNRYFFVEHHTLFPLIHWMDWSFGLGCRALGKAKWSRRETLILMSAARLKQIARNLGVAVEWAVGTTGLAFGPCSSNLFLSIKRKPAA